MYCKNCGKFLAGDEKFCSRCGEKVIYDSDIESEKSVQNKSDETAAEMVWDLEDFEEKDIKKETDFNWSTEGLFMHDEITGHVEDKDDYSGPLMFRTEDKAPKAPEENSEDEEAKNPFLFRSEGREGEGRWDISKVEIPESFKGSDTLKEEKKEEPEAEKGDTSGINDSQNTETEKINDEDNKYGNEEPEEMQPEKDDTDFPASGRIKGFEETDSLMEQMENMEIPEISDETSGEDDTLSQETEDYTETESETEDVSDETAEEKEEESGKESDSTEEDEHEVKPTHHVEFDWNRKVDIPGFDGKSPKNFEDKDVVDSNSSMSLEDLAAGKIGDQKEEDEPVKEADREADTEKEIYDESRKTIRNVLSRDTITVPLNMSSCNGGNQRVIDIEQPKKSNISLEIQEDDITGAKVEKILKDEPKAPEVSLKPEIVSEDRKNLRGGFQHREIGDDIKVAQVDDQSIVDEVIPSAMDVLKNEPDTDENDRKGEEKFYTFNKNKEEFQKLLDQEYRRLEGAGCDTKGFEEDIEGFMEITKGKEVEATSQIEEMNKARSVFVTAPSYEDVSVYEDEDFENVVTDTEDSGEAERQHKESAVQDEHVTADEEAGTDENPEAELGDDFDGTLKIDKDDEDDDSMKKAALVFEPKMEESLADTFIEQETAVKSGEQEKPEEKKPEAAEEPSEEAEPGNEAPHNGVSKMMIDPSENSDTEKLAKEFFDDEEEESTGGARNVLLGILGVILVIVIAVLGIVIILPDSPVAKIIDDKAGKVITTVMEFFNEDENAGGSKDSEIRETVMEDKTELIKLQQDRNYNNSIEDIFYDENLVYDEYQDYDLEGLKDAKDIQTVFWYEDKSGKAHYYDEEITGSIIEFVSMRTAWENTGDKAVMNILRAGTDEYEKVVSEGKGDSNKKVELLGIGDIKVSGNAYYVWASETIDGNTEEHVYEIKEQNQTLYVTDDCIIKEA